MTAAQQILSGRAAKLNHMLGSIEKEISELIKVPEGKTPGTVEYIKLGVLRNQRRNAERELQRLGKW